MTPKQYISWLRNKVSNTASAIKKETKPTAATCRRFRMRVEMIAAEAFSRIKTVKGEDI